MSAQSIIRRLIIMRELASGDSPTLNAALVRAGTLLMSEMRIQAGRQKIINSGRLLNSISYEVSGDTLTVGSRGIRYAAMNEFGGEMTPQQVKAMFYYMRLGGGRTPRPSKGVVTVRKDGSGFWKERPFIRPALKKQRENIVKILREAAISVE